MSSDLSLLIQGCDKMKWRIYNNPMLKLTPAKLGKDLIFEENLQVFMNSCTHMKFYYVTI